MAEITPDLVSKVVTWFASGTGAWWEVLVKVAVLMGGGLVLWFVKRWADNAALKEVDKQNQAVRLQDQADVVTENRQTERDALAAEQEVKKK